MMTGLITELELVVMDSQERTIIHSLIASIRRPMRRLAALESRLILKMNHPEERSKDSLLELALTLASTVSKATAEAIQLKLRYLPIKSNKSGCMILKVISKRPTQSSRVKMK